MLRCWREGRPITFYHYMIDLKHGPCIYKRVSGCGSGTEYMAVTPWGELFPCHQFVGDPKYSLGNIWDGVTNAAAQDEFRHCNAYSRPLTARTAGPGSIVRRLRRQQLPRHRQHRRRLTNTAAACSKAHRMRNHAPGRNGAR